MRPRRVSVTLAFLVTAEGDNPDLETNIQLFVYKNRTLNMNLALYDGIRIEDFRFETDRSTMSKICPNI